MGSIEETPEEANKDGTGHKLDFGTETKTPAKKQDALVLDKTEDAANDDDSYEDDNDFEPFETSKKDFYQENSIESKTQRTESEANTQRPIEQNHHIHTPNDQPRSQEIVTNHVTPTSPKPQPASQVVKIDD